MVFQERTYSVLLVSAGEKFAQTVMGLLPPSLYWPVTVVKSMADLGPARAAMLIVISQLAVAYVIELFGMFGVEKQPFEWRKLIGLLVSVTGIIVFKW